MHPCHETQISCKNVPKVSSKGLHLNSGDLRAGSFIGVLCQGSRLKDCGKVTFSYPDPPSPALALWDKTWNARLLLKIEYSRAGIMRYFKILMIEHLNNSLWLEILRGMNCMFRGGRSLTYSEDQNFCFSSFNIWKFSEMHKLQLLTCKRLSLAIGRKPWNVLSNSK